MGLCLFGCGGSNTTVQTNHQTTNVEVSVNPSIVFGQEALQPLATALAQANQGIIDRFEPLAQGIRTSLENANRLAGDLRRTADFSINPAVPAPPSVPPVLVLGAALVLGILVAKTL